MKLKQKILRNGKYKEKPEIYVVRSSKGGGGFNPETLLMAAKW